ncbi:hypothetical protein [Agarivorans sp. QJM3NY_25]|uniref:hypothetical protein n=1 Tax=Agarivorans sp. QJM3NY_25 TaxID=3421430 RepID=UPI003D7C4EED
MNNKIKITGQSSDSELNIRKDFFDYFHKNPLPDAEILNNLGLFLSRQNLSRMLFINEMYQKMLPIHGVIMEFGVRWGQNLSLLSSLRGMYEPFNYSRKLIGFDTFDGFPEVSPEDGNNDIIRKNSYSVSHDYDKYLMGILDYHESESPLSHIKKYELVKGDATNTIHKYLENNPETLISFAYFDFDIYKPTVECLKAIKPYLVKGAIIGFDELNCKTFPGETIAFQEVLGSNNYSIIRSPYNPLMSYIIFN